MKKLTKYVLAALIVLVTGTDASAQITKVGTTAAEFLRIPVGGRASAMSAITADIDDPSAMILNPGGLANINDNQIMVEYTDWFLDLQHSFLGVAIPTGDGVVGIHVLSLSMGEFEETTVEAQGKTGRTFNAYSISTGVSYAHKLTPDFSMGGTAKFIYEKIFNSTASTIAFDLGAMYNTPVQDLTFGVSITNAGSKLQMDGNDLIIPSDPDPDGEGNYEPDAKKATDAFKLPLMLRVGFAWDAINTEQVRATLAVDGNAPSNNVQSVSVGTEIGLLNNKVLLRAGLPYLGQGDKTEVFNAGIGFDYRLNPSLKLGINYAYHSYEYLSDVNKISLQIYF